MIIAGPYDSEFVRGKQAKLPCQVIGSPAPIVTWYRNSQPVTLGSKVILQDDNSLLFKRIHRRNVEGVYQCVARNAYGEARSANASVTVICMYHVLHIQYYQGRREGRAGGAICPRASGSKGPHN